jgi:predicted enzyme related to lactoylglutathione lyase
MTPNQLHLGVEDDFRAAKKAHPAFQVDDIDEIAAVLQSRGYSVIEDQVQLEGIRRVFTQDPFGNRIELVLPSY